MEQGPCWMWTKRKYSITSSNSPSIPSCDDSWEEQAFAEDAAGALGGCVWPPRSYSCSFCRREFRSAQALGGHMNVHRRDRARLKQPSSPPNEILCHDALETHHHNPAAQNPFPNSLNLLYSSPYGLAYKTSPNSDPAVLASPSSPSSSKALAPLINENFREETRNPSSNFSKFQEHNTTYPPLHSSKLWSNPAEDRFSHKFGIDPEADTEENSKIVDSGCKGKGENGKSDVGLSFNLIVCRAQSPVQFETNEAASTFKRRRTDASLIPFFPISSSIDRHDMQREMFGFNPSSVEELDLELRLGHRPEV